MLDVVEHLVRAEREVLQGLPDPDALVAQPQGLGARARYARVVALLRSPVPVGIPSEGMAPLGGTTLAAQREAWDASQRWLRTYIETAEDLGRAVFAHPVTGPLDAAQVVAMSAVHLRRHVGQIDRLRREAPATLRT